MKADLSRDSYDPHRHHSQVLMQQGRVQTDADWNEQGSVLLHQLRAAIADIVGPAGGRAATGWPALPGFAVLSLPAAASPVADFVIANGRYWVDGVLCELAAARTPVRLVASGVGVEVEQWWLDGRSLAPGQYVRIWTGAVDDAGSIARITAADHAQRTVSLDTPVMLAAGTSLGFLERITTYQTQRDLLSPRDLPAQGRVLVYLDVWERSVTSTEDPALRDTALGADAPDTAARVRTVVQVRAQPIPPDLPAAAPLSDMLMSPVPGLMRARAEPAKENEPSGSEAGAGYRRLENQLYRVEIHAGSETATPSFKWSRENGAVLAPVLSVSLEAAGIVVLLATLATGSRFGLAVGDIVELQSERTVLAAQQPALPLLRISAIDQDACRVHLAGVTAIQLDPADFAPEQQPVLRRWDHTRGVGADNAVVLPRSDPAQWIDLEDGVQVQFGPLQDRRLRAGDYWLLPARVATRDLVWPQETWVDGQGAMRSDPALRPPDGVLHRYAPLALIELSQGAAPVVQHRCQTVLGAR